MFKRRIWSIGEFFTVVIYSYFESRIFGTFSKALERPLMEKSALKLFILFLIQGIAFHSSGQASLVERLGYSKDAKLLIIHADDLAVAHSENQASFKALAGGQVSSASIMVPCPWLPEVADYVQRHPDHDLGLHLTLTSEWQPYKWGPVAPQGQVSSLVNDYGYFHDNCADLAKNAKLDEIETELRAQIEKAKSLGVEPTHLDSHMGCLFFTTPEIFGVYLKLGREYGIPVMIIGDMLESLPAAFTDQITEDDIVIDHAFMANPPDYQSGLAAFYSKVLHTLSPGVSIIIIHTAFDDPEMQGVTVNHPDWGASWRQADYDFFTSAECRSILEKEGIKLVTWRAIGKLYDK